MASGSKPVLGSRATKPSNEDDDLITLSGDKPFFDVIFSKSHVTEPYTMNLSKMVTNALPRGTKTVRLLHGDKSWDMEYVRSGRFQRFCARDWKVFVADNDLKTDDSMICEVQEVVETTAVVKVHLIRDIAAVPPELRAYYVEEKKKAEKNVIHID